MKKMMREPNNQVSPLLKPQNRFLKNEIETNGVNGKNIFKEPLSPIMNPKLNESKDLIAPANRF
jgi:hypothetical protein